MFFQLLLTFATCLAVGQSIACGTVTCATLDSGTCATKTNSTGYSINSQSCPNGVFCSAQNVLSWFNSLSSPYTLSCTATSSPMTSFVSNVTCRSHGTNKNFKSGNSLVFCQSNADCLLQDSTTTNCLCAFRTDGLAVCQPDPSNYVFREFWADCASNSSMSSTSNKFAYWTYYMSVWTFTQSNNTCIDNLLELQTLETLYQNIVTSGVDLRFGFFLVISLLS